MSSIKYILISSLLSGIICYRYGLFFGCASPWMAQLTASQNMNHYDSNIEEEDPAYFNNLDEPSVAKGNYNDYIETSIPHDPDDRRYVSRPSSPYKCGKYT